MKVYHRLLDEYLMVVDDEKGPAFTGTEFADDEIALSHALIEYKKGNLIIFEEAYSKEEWEIRVTKYSKKEPIKASPNLMFNVITNQLHLYLS